MSKKRGQTVEQEVLVPVQEPVQIPTQNQAIHFFVNGNDNPPVMTLAPEGMYYRGELVEDAGTAHRAFLEVMSTMKRLA